MTITVYTKPACVQCNATYKALDKQGIAYETVDITLDSEAREPGLPTGPRSRRRREPLERIPARSDQGPQQSGGICIRCNGGVCMTTAVDDPWSSDPRPRVPHQEVLPEPERFDDDAAATNHYAGPFCSCGDYSCPANDNPAARCVNHEDSSTYTGRYPESWNDEAIAAYEARELADALISDARHPGRGDTRLAVARLNALGAVLHPV